MPMGTTPRCRYVRAMAIAVLEETGLLPHLNPGVMSLGRPAAAASPVAPCMGMMLETTSRRLWSEPGGAALRLAGQGAGGPAAGAGGRGPRRACRSPPGLLIGIGETLQERAGLDLRDPARRPGSTAASRK